MSGDTYVEKLVAILRKVVQQTTERRVEWSDRGDGNTFELRTERASVVVYSVDSDGRAPFKVEILNGYGQVVESLSTISESYQPSEAAFNELLAEVYELARRSALQIDDVIQTLLEDLDNG